jgi:hypothetical protein
MAEQGKRHALMAAHVGVQEVVRQIILREHVVAPGEINLKKIARNGSCSVAERS